MAPVLARSLARLSRSSLIDLCLEWTQSRQSTPYLVSNRNLLESDEEDYLHEPAENIEQLRALYEELKNEDVEAGKDVLSKREIIDRIVDGDWRRGLSLHQHATIDFAHLEQNDSALRWSALKLKPLDSVSAESMQPTKKRKLLHQSHYPQMDATTFLHNLKHHVSPLVKANYAMRRLRPSNLVVLRLYIVPSASFAPSQSAILKSAKQATDAARIMYIALPDSCPYVYVSVSGSTPSNSQSDPRNSMKSKVDINTTKRIVLEAIPKAFSKPQERWCLDSTNLTTRSLRSICLLRGNGRPGTSGGAYSKFSDEFPDISITEGDGKTQTCTNTHVPPLKIQCPTPPPEEISELEIRVNRRFGRTAGSSHAALNRFHIKMENIYSRPPYALGQGERSAAKTGTQSTRKKRKRLSLKEIEQGEFQNHLSEDQTDTMEEQQQQQQPASLSMTMSGADVFAGLRQLALLGPEYINLDKVPAWMTGEKGVSGITV